jgi:hypothetical protein
MSASKAAELGAKANTSQLLRRTLPLSVFQSRLDLIWRVRSPAARLVATITHLLQFARVDVA